MVACEASGARGHGHDPKHEASSGRTNNVRKGVDESVSAVQLVEHAGRRSCRGQMIVLEERRGGEEHRAPQAGRPRPAGLPYLRSPPAPVFCRQASLSFLCLCVQVCVPKTSIDIANLPKIDSSKKNPHP
jgi:hypothetical protein